MRKRVYQGRFTVRSNENVVVFIIGMRVNKWYAVHQWWPVFTAMPPMLRELHLNKDLGFLAMESAVNFRTILLVQYWRSFEKLHAYAREAKHVSAWHNFYKKAGSTNAVGIFHETYLLENKGYEAVYGNMPIFGLAKALGHQEVTAKTSSARQRLRN